MSVHLVQSASRPVRSPKPIFSTLENDSAEVPRLEPDPWRPGSMQYTSGTRSRPKGVLWTHGYAFWGARASAMHETLNEDDIHCGSGTRLF